MVLAMNSLLEIIFQTMPLKPRLLLHYPAHHILLSTAQHPRSTPPDSTLPLITRKHSLYVAGIYICNCSDHVSTGVPQGKPTSAHMLSIRSDLRPKSTSGGGAGVACARVIKLWISRSTHAWVHRRNEFVEKVWPTERTSE